MSPSTLNLVPSWYLCDAIYVWHFCDHHMYDTMWFNTFIDNTFLKPSACLSTPPLPSFPASLCTGCDELHDKPHDIFLVLILFSAFDNVKYFSLKCSKSLLTFLSLNFFFYKDTNIIKPSSRTFQDCGQN